MTLTLIKLIVNYNEINSYTAHLWQRSWPTPTRKLGVVSQVSFDLSGNVVVFHRYDRVWNQATFNTSNEYQGERVPISDNTIVAFDRSSGSVVYEYGSDL